MKSNKKGLQKFTESQVKINALLSKDFLQQSDIADFTNEEKDSLLDRIQEIQEGLIQDQKKCLAFMNKVEPIMEQHVKNQIWENNQAAITNALSLLIQELGRMPTRNDIAEKTGLSRQSIHKHLKEYGSHPIYLQQQERFKFMYSKVLARVFSFAVQGDIKAARLYLEIVGNMENKLLSNTITNTQNNYIMINHIKLHQETIEKLTGEQLKQIEMLLENVLLESKREIGKKEPEETQVGIESNGAISNCQNIM